MGTLAGCKGSGGSIAVIPKGSTHEFWKAVHAGAEKAAQEFGVKIIWKGPLREDDREDQIKVMETFVNMHVKGIVLAPLDDAALVPVVTDAVRGRIPVVVFDSALKSTAPVSFVATDNYLAGRMAGDFLVRRIGDWGNIVMLRYAQGSASTAAREQGFLDALAVHKKMKILSSNQYGGATTESAFKASENLLAANKGPDGLKIHGIFCPNESTTFGMLRALQDGGFAGKVRFVGFDSSPKLVEALATGILDGIVVQDPINMGYVSVKTMVEHLQGKQVPAKIDTGATLINRENMDQPRSKELLNPDFGKWLNE